MKKTGSTRLSASATLAVLAASGILFDPGVTDRTPYPWELEPKGPKPEPRPEGMENFSKRARKAYARIMREGGSREEALKAAKELDGQSDANFHEPREATTP